MASHPPGSVVLQDRHHRRMRHTLRLHPDSQCSAVTRIEVQVTRPQPSGLLLAYSVTGKIGDLAMPPAAPPERTDELWRHTCFEAFVRNSPDAGYYEFNFAPSTQWAAYRFIGYRSGMRVATEIGRPRITVETSPERYVLHAALELDQRPDPAGGGRGGGGHATWHLGLSAVIEETSGRRSHWALAHPPGKPDFHHSGCFALELA